jgi:hypothetical protein
MPFVSRSIFVTLSGTATTPIEKADVLKARLIPPMPDAGHFDIPNASYPPEVPSPMSIAKEEISSVIKNLYSFKAAGSDGMPFLVL